MIVDFILTHFKPLYNISKISFKQLSYVDKIYSLISQALQQGKLTKDAQAVFMKWMADPNSTEEAIIKALESITGNRNVEETYGDISYNGHAKKDPKYKNDMTNFGILMEINGIEDHPRNS